LPVVNVLYDQHRRPVGAPSSGTRQCPTPAV
jgi:hypothetical protein